MFAVNSIQKGFVLMTGLIAFGLLFFISVNGPICNWKNLNITGVIIKSTKYDDPSNKDRYSTVYIIRDNNGNKTQYEAKNDDFSLQRDLPVGTIINKKKGKLNYSINGKIVDDFSEDYYSTVSNISIAVMLIGLFGSIITLALIIKKVKTR